VPWRFSDAGRQSAWIGSAFRRPKTCTTTDMFRLQIHAGANSGKND
jgi:hypothetical protein